MATGTIGADIMDYDFQVEYTQTWSGGVQAELLPRTVFEVQYMGSYTIGADNSTVRNVPRSRAPARSRHVERCPNWLAFERSGSTASRPITP